MTLCASICWPSSHAKVTSVNSLSFRKLSKAELMLSLKLFHCTQSFSDIMIKWKTFESEWSMEVWWLIVFFADFYCLWEKSIHKSWTINRVGLGRVSAANFTNIKRPAILFLAFVFFSSKCKLWTSAPEGQWPVKCLLPLGAPVCSSGPPACSSGPPAIHSSMQNIIHK